MTLPDPLPLVIPRGDHFMHTGVARVETTTLLPGGMVVTLALRRQGDRYVVDDEGCGRTALAALGIQDLTRADVRRGTDIADMLGMTFAQNMFRLSDVAESQLQSAISFVSEACRNWAATTAEVRQKSRDRDVASRAVERLRASFPSMDVQVERELPGASTKLHRFDVVVSLPRERFAVFETLLPAASSIAAAHLKFYDLGQAHPNWPREALVEDLSEWASEDLAMMQQVASGVRGIGAAWDDLRDLAA